MEEYIKKIVELDIDIDDLELENMGVDVVSFVTDPAIEVEFLAFNAEEFVYPTSNEEEDDFMKRCMPVLVGEGKASDQAYAICKSYYEMEFAEGMPHYTKDGVLYEGPTHKDADGRLMTGETHTEDSEYLYHEGELAIDVYNTIEEDKEMVEGIIELILKIDDIENRKEIVIDTISDFAKQGVQFDLDLFLLRVGVDLFDEYAEVGPRGGIKASPKAPPAKGPNKNPKGVGTSRGKATDSRSAEVSKKAEASLQKKSDDFNERYKDKLGYGTTIGQLKAVYQRGKGAYNRSHSPAVSSSEQWAQARVNAYLYLVKNGRPQNKNYKQDNDLLPSKHPKSSESQKMSMQFESYNDYPESAVNAAKRALEWRDSHPDNTCGTAVGWARANQLAKRENISEETIARMASFARHLQYKDVPFSDGCGGLMVSAWGGQAGIEWASNKLKSIRVDLDINTSGLQPYTDQIDRETHCGCNHTFSEEDLTQEQRVILEWALEHGEEMTADYTYIKEGEKFSTVGDIVKGIQGLDILSKLGITSNEPAETKYSYTGPSAQRSFCKGMMSLNKMYSTLDLGRLEDRLGSLNPNMGPGGINTYDVFNYKGGVNCQHFWSQLSVFKPEGGKVLVIEKGPAAGLAGQSNNDFSPSPTGAVDNNARMSFSILNDEKRLVAGALMIPNQMILRKDEDGEPYYVYFTADTIRRIQERFNKDRKHNLTDTQHDGEITSDNILLEQWLVEHPTYDKSRFYGFDRLKTGTWFGVYKVTDDDTWKRIKSGELRGFSIAGNFIERAKPVRQEDQLLNKIISVLRDIE